MRPTTRLLPRSLTGALSSSSPASVCPACVYRQQLQHTRRPFASSPAATVSPHPPPPSGLAALSSRRLISISGVDAARFLQGIICSSIYAPGSGPAAETPRGEGLYTGLLSAQGRILHDVFIYPDTLGAAADGTKLGQSFLIEVDAGEAQRLERHIRRYKLRSKFKVRALDAGEVSVWQAWDDTTITINLSTDLSAAAKSDAATIILRDTRTPAMGHRVLRRGDAFPEDVGLARADENAYTVRRYLQGVPEGQEELAREHALPLDSNIDIMGGVDFRKGCYVGQELTIRTKHRGIVRKRILPVALYDEGRAPPTALAYHPPSSGDGGREDGAPGQVVTAEMVPADTSIGRVGKKGRSAGKWIKGVGNIGLALCRLETMTDVEVPGAETAAGAGFDPSIEFVMALDKWAEGGEDGGAIGGAPSVRVKAFVPDWLRKGIEEGGRHGA